MQGSAPRMGHIARGLVTDHVGHEPYQPSMGADGESRIVRRNLECSSYVHDQVPHRLIVGSDSIRDVVRPSRVREACVQRRAAPCVAIVGMHDKTPDPVYDRLPSQT
jgi:hypothetical protein